MKTSCVALFLCACLINLNGAIVISTDGTDAANLQSIDIDGTVFSGSDLIGVDVTAFNMTPNGDDTFQIVPTGTGVNANTGTAATGLMEDSSLTTGYAGLVSLSFDFLSPVTNRPGVELFIFEYNPVEGSALNVTLNGSTTNIAASGNPFTATGSTVDTDINGNSSTAATSIGILEGITSFTNTNLTQTGSSIGYHAIDLDDYGVASGASVSDITLTGFNDWDITGVVAVIPEPPTLALVLSALIPLVVLRRRHRR